MCESDFLVFFSTYSESSLVETFYWTTEVSLEMGKRLGDMESIKKKIMIMLNEEGFEFKEIGDPNTHFNLIITAGGLPYNIFQNVSKRDSVFIAGSVKLSSDQIILYSKMEQSQKKEFFGNLRISLLTRPSLGDFKIKTKPPEYIEEVFLSSKPIFHTELEKETLFSTLFEIHKCSMMVTWMFEETVGVASRANSLHLFYA